MLKKTVSDLFDFRQALGCFATGVSVVTTYSAPLRPDAGDGSVGVTVNSFSSVSLDPPLVAFSLYRVGRRISQFIEAGHFCINVLAREQEALSRQFSAANGDVTCESVGYTLGTVGSPVLAHVLASFECTLEDTVEGGDHLLFLGRVQHYAYDASKTPLLFFRGTYTGLTG